MPVPFPNALIHFLFTFFLPFRFMISFSCHPYSINFVLKYETSNLFSLDLIVASLLFFIMSNFPI